MFKKLEFPVTITLEQYILFHIYAAGVNIYFFFF